MASELIINASLPETRIALMENGEIQELLIERASGKGIVGNIYKGRVTRVLPGMQAAFVDIGLEKAAFLYVDDVFVHSHIWDNDEVETEEVGSDVGSDASSSEGAEEQQASSPEGESTTQEPRPSLGIVSAATQDLSASEEAPVDVSDEIADDLADNDGAEEEEEEDGGPIEEMSDGPDEPEGTVSGGDGGEGNNDTGGSESGSGDSGEGDGESQPGAKVAGATNPDGSPKKFNKRGRRRGRGRRRPPGVPRPVLGVAGAAQPTGVVGEGTEGSVESLPSNYQEQMMDAGDMTSDRSDIQPSEGSAAAVVGDEGRPTEVTGSMAERRTASPTGGPRPAKRPEFSQPRAQDRRIKPKPSARLGQRAQVNIQDLLKEGQEIIVQVAKDPIATKGARLTCHISLPGRYLVCMPTIDHVGVSRRIDRDDDRRKLRDIVERNRPKKLGFIVRTAIGRNNTEKRIKQDIDYLTAIWTEIKEKAAGSSAPSMIYEDLNAVLRSIRDWVNEEIDKIIVDSRYHFGEIQRFVSHFMPAIRQKVELYHGDIPIFDAYSISTEMSRALDRKVWLKSGGYLVIDQAEALVAIDVNTGRFVGKKSLEDTILKTNLEAVKEIAYQLRLRNCGGIIILDLIDMEREENKQRVYRALEEALKKDRARPSIMKISDIGLIEMTRKRTRDTVIRTLCEPCAHCEGKGYIKTKQTVGYEALREIERAGIDRDSNKILVQGHAEVIDFLAIDERETLDQLERKYRKSVYLQAVADYHPEQFEVSTEKKDRKHSEAAGAPAEDRRPEQQQRQQPKRQFQPPQLPKPRPLDIPANPIKIVTSADGATSLTRADDGSQPVSLGEGSSEVVMNVAPTTPSVLARGPHDDMDEEDRLAFLRAQATQDAALAQMQAGRAPGSRPVGNGGMNGGGGGRGPGGHGGGGRNQNGRRGRRGGGRGAGQHQQGGAGNGRFQGPRHASFQPVPRPVSEPGNGPAVTESAAVVVAPSSDGGGENT